MRRSKAAGQHHQTEGRSDYVSSGRSIGGMVVIMDRKWSTIGLASRMGIGCVVGCSNRVLLVGSGDRDQFLRSSSSPLGPQERNSVTQAIATTTTNEAVERGDTSMMPSMGGTRHLLKASKVWTGAQAQIRNTGTSG